MDYSQLISVMNQAAASKNEVKFKEYLKFFTNVMLPRHTEEKWVCIPEDIVDESIVVLAHSNRPIRALGYVFYDTEKNKLVFKRISFHHETNKRSIDRKSRKSLEIYTCRRGFWVVLESSLSYKLSLKHVDYTATSKKLQELYIQYVRGMEVPPSHDLILGFEQFKIGECPTTDWTNSVNTKLDIIDSKLKKKMTTDKVKETKKRKRSIDDTTTEESSDEIDSDDVREHPSEYVIMQSTIPKYVEPVYELKTQPDLIESVSCLKNLSALFTAVEIELENEYNVVDGIMVNENKDTPS